MTSGPDLIIDRADRTSSGETPPIGTHGEPAISIAIDCTSVQGNQPTCTFSIQWSMDDGLTFHTSDPADIFATITAPAKVVKTFATKGNACKLVWTIGGTLPSFNFTARKMEF